MLAAAWAARRRGIYLYLYRVGRIQGTRTGQDEDEDEDEDERKGVGGGGELWSGEVVVNGDSLLTRDGAAAKHVRGVLLEAVQQKRQNQHTGRCREVKKEGEGGSGDRPGRSRCRNARWHHAVSCNVQMPRPGHHPLKTVTCSTDYTAFFHAVYQYPVFTKTKWQ